MTFESIKKEFLPELEAKIESYLRSPLFDRWPASREMMLYQMHSGGKRFRALIPAYVLSVFGKDPRQGLGFGAAIEIIHNATLVHDDFQDGDEIRRNQPTVWKKFSWQRSICCGDSLFYAGIDFIHQLPLPIEIRSQLVTWTLRQTFEVIEGQTQEFMMKEEPAPSVERYLEVARMKTSALLTLPFIGALRIAGTPAEHCEEYRPTLDSLGLLFQIQDDWIDLYGNKGRSSQGNDIAEGKTSFMVAWLNAHGRIEDKISLNRILSLPREQTKTSDIESAFNIFETSGARQAALNQMKDIEASFSRPDLDPKVSEALRSLANLIMRPHA